MIIATLHPLDPYTVIKLGDNQRTNSRLTHTKKKHAESSLLAAKCTDSDTDVCALLVACQLTE